LRCLFFFGRFSLAIALSVLLWSFFSGHCVVCSSSIYRLLLPLWYLQTLLVPSYNFIWRCIFELVPDCRIPYCRLF
jgi:hypothetical protein